MFCSLTCATFCVCLCVMSSSCRIRRDAAIEVSRGDDQHGTHRWHGRGTLCRRNTRTTVRTIYHSYMFQINTLHRVYDDDD